MHRIQQGKKNVEILKAFADDNKELKEKLKQIMLKVQQVFG